LVVLGLDFYQGINLSIIHIFNNTIYINFIPGGFHMTEYRKTQPSWWL